MCPLFFPTLMLSPTRGHGRFTVCHHPLPLLKPYSNPQSRERLLPALHSPWRPSLPLPSPPRPLSSTAAPPHVPATTRSSSPSARRRRIDDPPGSPAAPPRFLGRSLPRRLRPGVRRGCPWCPWRRCRAGSGA
jgi:hypothetical protein